jgi:hypothetical protein
MKKSVAETTFCVLIDQRQEAAIGGLRALFKAVQCGLVNPSAGNRKA